MRTYRFTEEESRLLRRCVRRMLEDEERAKGIDHPRAVAKLSRLIAKLEGPRRQLLLCIGDS